MSVVQTQNFPYATRRILLQKDSFENPIIDNDAQTFFKFLGILCDSHMFKLGYSEQKFSFVLRDYGIFLRIILKRIISHLYLLQ